MAPQLAFFLSARPLECLCHRDSAHRFNCFSSFSWGERCGHAVPWFVSAPFGPRDRVGGIDGRWVVRRQGDRIKASGPVPDGDTSHSIVDSCSRRCGTAVLWYGTSHPSPEERAAAALLIKRIFHSVGVAIVNWSSINIKVDGGYLLVEYY